MSQAMERLALSHPEIAFRFLADGVLKFATAGDGKLQNAIYAVYGGAFATKLIPVSGGSEGIRISGYISSPENTRGNRGMQQFFINSRCVKSKTLTAALEAKGILGGLPLEGDQAGCILWCCTEMNTREELDRTVAILRELC